jgi:hypothetical protein
MSLMASLSNPYIVEYKDGWVDEVLLLLMLYYYSTQPQFGVGIWLGCCHVGALSAETEFLGVCVCVWNNRGPLSASSRATAKEVTCKLSLLLAAAVIKFC